jgi:hypothetical protein
MARNKRVVMDKISKLGRTEHEEIFKILIRHNVGYMQNSNGIFCNFSTVSDEILSEIETFVEYCEKNQLELDAYDKKINYGLLSKNGGNVLQPALNSDLGIVLQSNEEQDEIIKDTVMTSDKVRGFVNMLENNLERIHNKNSNSKFVYARKRYSRKLISDKKTYSDCNCNLHKEDYCYKKK